MIDGKPKAKNSDLNTRRLKSLDRWAKIIQLVCMWAMVSIFAGGLILFPLAMQGDVRQIVWVMFSVVVVIFITTLFALAVVAGMAVFERAIQWVERRNEPAKKKKRH